jgi:hypothetical protein
MKCTTALVALHVPLTAGWRPTSTDYIDHETLPVRCHMTRRSREAELCDMAFDAIALSWPRQVDEIGFAEPILDEDGIFDVYITDEYTEGGAYVAGEGGDADPDDDRMGQPSYMALDPTIPTDEFASYVAHEFNHVLQYSMDFTEPTLPVWEATATAAEAWTLDDYKVWGEWVADFQEHSWMGLLGDGYILWDDYGIWSYHEYGAAIWILHLDHTYYDGTGEGGAELWWALTQDGWSNEPDVLDAWGDVTVGKWYDALTEFVAFNLVSDDPARRPAWVDDRDDGNWGPVPMDSVSEADLPATVTPEWGIAPSGWVHVELPDAPEHLVVSYEGDEDSRYALVAVAADGTVQTTTDWPVRLEATGPVDVAVVNLGDVSFDGDDRLVMSEIDISFAVVPPEEDPDTDDPVDTDIPDDTDDPIVDDTPPADSSDDDSKSRGCAVVGTGASWTAIVGLMAIARRRRSSVLESTGQSEQER